MVFTTFFMAVGVYERECFSGWKMFALDFRYWRPKLAVDTKLIRNINSFISAHWSLLVGIASFFLVS